MSSFLPLLTSQCLHQFADDANIICINHVVGDFPLGVVDVFDSLLDSASSNEVEECHWLGFVGPDSVMTVDNLLIEPRHKQTVNPKSVSGPGEIEANARHL